MARHTRPERSGRGSFPALGLAGRFADLIADPAEPASIALRLGALTGHDHRLEQTGHKSRMAGAGSRARWGASGAWRDVSDLPAGPRQQSSRYSTSSAVELAARSSGGLSMHINKVAHVTIVDRVAERFVESAGWLFDVANEMDVEDGAIWVCGLGDESDGVTGAAGAVTGGANAPIAYSFPSSAF